MIDFDNVETIPQYYRSLLNVLSPLEKSAIMKLVNKQQNPDLSPNEFFLAGLKDYLLKYQGEDISPLIFIIIGSLISTLEKEQLLDEVLALYPDSPELRLFKIEQQFCRGIFEDLSAILPRVRLKPDQRELFFKRIPSAEKLAAIILELHSYYLELRYHLAQDVFTTSSDCYRAAESIWQRVLEWTERQPIAYLYELIAQIIIQYIQIQFSTVEMSNIVTFYEREDIQDIFAQATQTITKAEINQTGAMAYYSAGNPQKAVNLMEKALSFLPQVPGRNEWKSGFYHNYARIMYLLDTERAIELMEESIAFLEGTTNLQSLTSTLSNYMGILIDCGYHSKGKAALQQLVRILDVHEGLINTFQAYAIATNALTLENLPLANKYLKILRERIEEDPTVNNKSYYTNAMLQYYVEGEINYPEFSHWAEENLFYITQLKDYQNVLFTLETIAKTEFDFYKMTKKKLYLARARKRINEMFSLLEALESPEYLARKAVISAALEILSENYPKAEKLLPSISIDSSEITLDCQMLQELLLFSQQLKEERGGSEKISEAQEESVFIQKIASSNGMIFSLLTQIVEENLGRLTSTIDHIPEPVKAEIQMILLTYHGMGVYTKVFDKQSIDKQLISGFISAIDNFANELFGKKEPYFSFARGEDIILFQKVTEHLNLAMIVRQESFDALMKLHRLTRELEVFLEENPIELGTSLTDSSPVIQFLKEKVDEIS